MSPANESERQFLRHALATVAYRAGKALRGAPESFATFKASESWRASPMTYMVNGRQYVAIAAGGNILSFALGER